MKIRIILCATDFSEFSSRAVEHASLLARRHEAELTLLHVYPFLTVALGGDAPYFPALPDLDEAGRGRLLRDLEDAARPARAAGVKTAVKLVSGDPSDVILDAARSLHADLVVMGTHGRRGFDRWLLGSVANRVVQKAHCAVLTVPKPAEAVARTVSEDDENVFCAVDLNEAQPVLEAAVAIAQRASGRLTVMHVVDNLEQHSAVARMAHIDWADFQERVEQEARQKLRSVLAAMDTRGIAIDEFVVSGSPHHTILRVAEARVPGLIVMGIHGRNAIGRLFLGSTALQVLRHARCPVLTIRAGAPASAVH
jgi:nucleotide-binding universal stress UspA family protein